MTEKRSRSNRPPSEAELNRLIAERHKQSVKRQQMKKALRSVVSPILRRARFTGTCPRYRRLTPERYDLLMFEFNKFDDIFTIQIGQCAPDDWGNEPGTFPREKWTDTYLAHRLKKIDPEYLRFDQRARIQPGPGVGLNDVFQYGDAKTPDDYRRVALLAVPYTQKALAGFDDFRRFAQDNKLDRR
jgi:hypothetical protein